MRSLSILLASSLFIACASTPSQDTGTARVEGPTGEARNANPYGVLYPTENVGTAKRSGTNPGQKIGNFQFFGYHNSDDTKGPVRVALADYFDPEMRNYRLIHIQAAGTWCPYCRDEQRDINPRMGDLVAKKVHWITAVVEGKKSGEPSDQTDLDGWLKTFKTTNTLVLDSGRKNFGAFFSSGGIPWNATIDARTMEILTYNEGYLAPDAVMAEADKWLKFQDENPAK